MKSQKAKYWFQALQKNSLSPFCFEIINATSCLFQLEALSYCTISNFKVTGHLHFQTNIAADTAVKKPINLTYRWILTVVWGWNLSRSWRKKIAQKHCTPVWKWWHSILLDELVSTPASHFAILSHLQPDGFRYFCKIENTSRLSCCVSPGAIILPTQAMHYNKGKAWICIVWFPQNG